jgi:hypothetical protein
MATNHSQQDPQSCLFSLAVVAVGAGRDQVFRIVDIADAASPKQPSEKSAALRCVDWDKVVNRNLFPRKQSSAI